MKRILHHQYKNLCDSEFTTDSTDLPENGSVVFVHMEHIYEFFRRIRDTENKYVLVSANSDYSFVEQETNPVWMDMYKWTRGFLGIRPELEYNAVVIPPRCNPAKCRIDDKFSIKVYSHTGWTVDKIPKNIIKWYSTNNSIRDHEKLIINIPFGIPDWTDTIIERALQKDRDKSRKNKFYYSCSPNHLMRLDIENYYKGCDFIKFGSNNDPHEEYIETLFDTEFVICPPGNGLDSFRVLESIYCGATPVILDTVENRCYDGLPVVKVDNFFYLDKVYNSCSGKIPEIGLDNTKADMLYWENRIGSLASLGD